MRLAARYPLSTRLTLAVAGLLAACVAALWLAATAPASRWALAGAGLAAAASTALALHTGRRFFVGIEALRGAAARLASGQAQVAMTVTEDDEVGALARAFNEMAAATAASYREIEEQNRNLERIVRLSTEELRHKNLALAFQNEKVNEANKLKSAFLASVSHELRTPLNAILALSEMLRDQISGPLSDEQTKQAAMIFRSGENLLHLINQVLDLSKIESGRMEVHRTPVRIVEVLAEAASGLRPLAEEKGLEFVIQAERAGIEVLLDSDKLRQVFVNLLGNAIKFTEQGKVRASIRLLSDEDLLYVEVQDTGPGIAPEHHHMIFQEFQQVERTGAAAKGTGLGLAISRKLIHLLGGDIWVDSDRGRGSRFAFIVPLAQREEPAEGTNHQGWAERRGTGRGRQRVMVVDDDVVEAGVLARYLRRQGLEVVTALDGAEAIGTLRREPADLVIVDLLQAGNDARELVGRMQDHPLLRSVPVIVNGSRPLTDEECAFLEPRVRTVFTKGTRGVGDLIAEVNEALACASATSAVGSGPGAVPLAGFEGLDEVA